MQRFYALNFKMAEKEKVFSSKLKHEGIFSFKDFYQFCYDWLDEETGLGLSETKYVEKLKGDEKEVEVEWEGSKKLTDYFKFEAKVEMTIKHLKNVEVNQGGAKVKTNQGEIEVKISGTLIRDYEGKFEVSAFYKFLRSIYEKWVIPSRIEEFEDKIISNCDDFLSQAKAYLDLEGKR